MTTCHACGQRVPSRGPATTVPRAEAHRQVMALRAAKGWGSLRISREVGINQGTVGSWLYRGVVPGRTSYDVVPNDDLREAVQRSGMSLAAVARVVGLDREHMRRALGIGSQGRRNISYANAVKIAEAIGLDPVDVGL